ncbi:MAG: Uncharacterised protein [uncultured Bacteroidota bacterium]|nr:MAG: Uncharacterised protein [uncultured Bacteroidetes bacterium]
MDADYLTMSIKKSFSIEYDFHASPQLLFQYLSTPSGLSEWFADNVNSRGERFTFIWDDSEETALLLQKKNNDKVKFQWQNDEEDDGEYYFEFKIQVDEITKDVSLIVTDFAKEDELEESKMLWDNLVSDLKQVLGAS